MSDEGGQRALRRQRSIPRVHFALARRHEEMARPLELPRGLDVQAFDLQVAGHQGTQNAKYLGLLQCSNGTILKPILKEAQQREVDFYARLSVSEDRDLQALRALVPRYCGCTSYTYNGHQQRYIMLEDLTQRMLQQCVMDVKIGRRTWDPLASEEKIKSEQSKYAKSKEQFGFCIPGYQVHDLATDQLIKRGKEHGKKLQGNMVREALKTYLNWVSQRACRALLLQLLPQLWLVQRWAREQRAARLYCASLLLVYDAARLRDCCGGRSRGRCASMPPRPRSAPTGGGHLGGQLTDSGPVYRKLSSVPLTPMTAASQAFAPQPPLTSPWTEALDKYDSNHSFDHNYEKNLTKMKADYRVILDELSSDTPNPNTWATVKIIDFAHVFFNEDNERAPDENFLEGINNFVKLFEDLLQEVESNGQDIMST